MDLYTDGDGVGAQEDSVRLQNSNSKKKVILKIDLSHTELLRNCEHLFTEPSEKSIPEKQQEVSKRVIRLLIYKAVL